jgi:hypothetical protein
MMWRKEKDYKWYGREKEGRKTTATQCQWPKLRADIAEVWRCVAFFSSLTGRQSWDSKFGEEFGTNELGACRLPTNHIGNVILFPYLCICIKLNGIGI